MKIPHPTLIRESFIRTDYCREIIKHIRQMLELRVLRIYVGGPFAGKMWLPLAENAVLEVVSEVFGQGSGYAYDIAFFRGNPQTQSEPFFLFAVTEITCEVGLTDEHQQMLDEFITRVIDKLALYEREICLVDVIGDIPTEFHTRLIYETRRLFAEKSWTIEEVERDGQWYLVFSE